METLIATSRNDFLVFMSVAAICCVSVFWLCMVGGGRSTLYQVAFSLHVTT